MKIEELEQSSWETGRFPPQLGINDVHVWAVRLSHRWSEVSLFEELLSEDEKTRAGRFRFDRDRQQYRITHGLLRILVGQYLASHPATVQFSENEYGKPAVTEGNLAFNISHSRGAGLMAFTRGRDIGVDLEWMNCRIATDQLAKYAFSEWEYDQYAAVSDDQKYLAFYNCWTRKEAFVKALGKGLAMPLGSFDVSVQPGHDTRLVRIEGGAIECQQWTMHSLTPFPGYAGTVLARGRDWNLSCFSFPEDEEALSLHIPGPLERVC